MFWLYKLHNSHGWFSKAQHTFLFVSVLHSNNTQFSIQSIFYICCKFFTLCSFSHSISSHYSLQYYLLINFIFTISSICPTVVFILTVIVLDLRLIDDLIKSFLNTWDLSGKQHCVYCLWAYHHPPKLCRSLYENQTNIDLVSIVISRNVVTELQNQQKTGYDYVSPTSNMFTHILYSFLINNSFGS